MHAETTKSLCERVCEEGDQSAGMLGTGSEPQLLHQVGTGELSREREAHHARAASSEATIRRLEQRVQEAVGPGGFA